MPKATFKRPWRFAVGGVRVVDYQPGIEYEVTDRCLEAAGETDNLVTAPEPTDTPRPGRRRMKLRGSNAS